MRPPHPLPRQKRKLKLTRPSPLIPPVLHMMRLLSETQPLKDCSRQGHFDSRRVADCPPPPCSASGLSAPMEARIARVIPSRFGRSSIRPGVSIFSAKKTAPVGCSTQPTHQPTAPLHPVFPLRIQSRPASTRIRSLTNRWSATSKGSLFL